MFQKFRKGLAAVGAGFLAAVTSAHAALPAGVADGFDAITSDATSLAGYAGAAVMVVLGFSIGLKLTKRFANKV